MPDPLIIISRIRAGALPLANTHYIMNPCWRKEIPEFSYKKEEIP